MEAFDFSDWDDSDEEDFKKNLEAYRRLSMSELREMMRNLPEGINEQIRELYRSFVNLPSERGEKYRETTKERFLTSRQAMADAMFIVIFLH